MYFYSILIFNLLRYKTRCTKHTNDNEKPLTQFSNSSRYIFFSIALVQLFRFGIQRFKRSLFRLMVLGCHIAFVVASTWFFGFSFDSPCQISNVTCLTWLFDTHSDFSNASSFLVYIFVYIFPCDVLTNNILLQNEKYVGTTIYERNSKRATMPNANIKKCEMRKCNGMSN